MPPVDPLQRADADAATQPLLLGSALTDPTDGVSYADTSGHPADEQPAGEANAAQEHGPSSRRTPSSAVQWPWPRARQRPEITRCRSGT